MPPHSSDVTSPSVSHQIWNTISPYFPVLWRGIMARKHYIKITFALVDIKWMISSFYPIRYFSSWVMTKNVFIKSQWAWPLTIRYYSVCQWVHACGKCKEISSRCSWDISFKKKEWETVSLSWPILSITGKNGGRIESTINNLVKINTGCFWGTYDRAQSIYLSHQKWTHGFVFRTWKHAWKPLISDSWIDIH